MIEKKYSIIHETVKLGFHVNIGSPGFKVLKDRFGNNYITDHPYMVVIGKGCNIGNYVCIDRGRTRDTVLGDYVMVDNYCHIGHNCWVKKNVILCTGVILGGGTVVGEGAYLSLGVITRDNIIIGKNAFIKMGAIVTDDVPENGKVRGYYPQRNAKDPEEHHAYVGSNTKLYGKDQVWCHNCDLSAQCIEGLVSTEACPITKKK